MARTIKRGPREGVELDRGRTLVERRGAVKHKWGPADPNALHLVLPELVFGEVLEPLLQPAHVHGFSAHLDAAGALDDRVLDEDLRPRTKGEGDRVGRA